MPGQQSLRSKLCQVGSKRTSCDIHLLIDWMYSQVYTGSQWRWCCRLSPWLTLTDSSLGYRDSEVGQEQQQEKEE